MTTRTTDLVYAGASLRERQDYAIALSKAGELIPRGLRDPNGAPNAGKILLVTEYGNALGIHPIVAINGIDIIEGNLTITPALMSGLIREAGHKLRVSTDGTGQALTATAVLVRADDPQHPFKVTWTMQDAKAAGLDGKSNWKKYPRAMLKARAISEVAREGAEDVLMGVTYTADEMGAVVNEAGEVIDAEIVEPEPGTPGKVAARGHANETRVTSASNRQATPDEAPESTPSGTVDLSGAGRDNPALKPTTKSAASWIRDIQAAQTIQALGELHAMAMRDNALGLKGRDGNTVDDWGRRRAEELTNAAAGEPDPTEGDYADIPDEVLY